MLMKPEFQALGRKKARLTRLALGILGGGEAELKLLAWRRMGFAATREARVIREGMRMLKPCIMDHLRYVGTFNSAYASLEHKSVFR